MTNMFPDNNNGCQGQNYPHSIDYTGGKYPVASISQPLCKRPQTALGPVLRETMFQFCAESSLKGRQFWSHFLSLKKDHT